MIRTITLSAVLATATASATAPDKPNAQFDNHPDAAELAEPSRQLASPLPKIRTSERTALIEEGGKAPATPATGSKEPASRGQRPMASLASASEPIGEPVGGGVDGGFARDRAAAQAKAAGGAQDQAPTHASSMQAAAPEETVAAPRAAALPAPTASSNIGPAQAEQASPAKLAARLTEAERVFAHEEAVLLRQIRLLDLNLEINERHKRLRELRNPTPETLAGAAPIAQASTVALSEADSKPRDQPMVVRRPSHPFKLLSIWGGGDALRAEFSTGSTRRTVTPGEHIHEGWMLEDVRHGEVIVRNGTHRSTLKLGM